MPKMHKNFFTSIISAKFLEFLWILKIIDVDRPVEFSRSRSNRPADRPVDGRSTAVDSTTHNPNPRPLRILSKQFIFGHFLAFSFNLMSLTFVYQARSIVFLLQLNMRIKAWSHPSRRVVASWASSWVPSCRANYVWAQLSRRVVESRRRVPSFAPFRRDS